MSAAPDHPLLPDPEPGEPNEPAAADAALSQLRAAMDAVNTRLCLVLHERAQLCRRIAAHKRAAGLALVDPAREQRMLAALLQQATGDGYSREQLASILGAVFAASREVVGEPPN